MNSLKWLVFLFMEEKFNRFQNNNGQWVNYMQVVHCGTRYISLTLLTYHKYF